MENKETDEINLTENTEIERTERRLFTREERIEILKSSNNRCACCGKKLTTKSMTVEHIIPLYRGGTNDMENLTALCKTCNEDKGNILYLPKSFYSALMGTNRIKQMDKMVREWFKGYKDNLDIERYPLIAPKHNVAINPLSSSQRKNVNLIYNRQLIVSWILMSTEEDYAEVEAISNVNLKTVRNFLEKVRPDAHEDERHLYPHHETYKPVAFYMLRKLSNDKLLALAAVRYDKETKDIVIYIIWTDMTKHKVGSIVDNLTCRAFDSIINIAGEKINSYAIISYQKEVFEYYHLGIAMGVEWTKSEEFCYKDTITNKTMYIMIIYIGKNKIPLKPTNFIDIPKWLEPIAYEE